MTDPIRFQRPAGDGFTAIDVELSRAITWVIEDIKQYVVTAPALSLARYIRDAIIGNVCMQVAPEYGRHPRSLGRLVNQLRIYGVPVVIATWSPHMLDYADPAADQVLIAFDTPDGYAVRPIDWQRVANFLDEFQLGEVWFIEGERGLISKDDPLARVAI